MILAISTLALSLLGMITARFIPRRPVPPSPVWGWDPRTIMMVVVSIVVLASSLYIILSRKYEDDAEKFAYGAIGTIMGYWLKA